ncbi:hypothetical protein AKJ16_DCAP06300, partial [Drosera capensis]
MKSKPRLFFKIPRFSSIAIGCTNSLTFPFLSAKSAIFDSLAAAAETLETLISSARRDRSSQIRSLKSSKEVRFEDLIRGVGSWTDGDRGCW